MSLFMAGAFIDSAGLLSQQLGAGVKAQQCFQSVCIQTGVAMHS